MSSSGLHKAYQDGGGWWALQCPQPQHSATAPPHSSVPLLMNTNCLISVLQSAGRGGAQDVSHHSSINLNWIIQNTAKYLQIKMNIARPGAGADLEPAERRQNSIILIRNSGLFFLSNLQQHFVFTQIEGSGKENNKSHGILSMS